MLLIGMDLEFVSLYVLLIWLSREIFRNLLSLIYRQGEIRQMKNLAIRTFVVALAVAGFTASSYSASTARANQAKVVVAHPGIVNTPTTMCSPGSTCGLD
jgi:hypothetical protein